MKKTLTKIILAASVTALLLAGCGSKNNQNAPETEEQVTETVAEKNDGAIEVTPDIQAEPEVTEEPAQNDNIPDDAIVVETAEELLGAIGPDRTIVLKAGTYNLSGVIRDEEKEIGNEYLYTESVNWDSEVRLFDIRNLSIIGPSDGKAEIVIEEPYSAVLTFEFCENISLSNITMGHTVEKGYCTGSVLRLLGCNNVNLEGMDLYGCGTNGIEAANTNRLNVSKSTIRECSYGIVDMKTCSDIVFDNCMLKENENLDLLYLSRCEVTFKDCVFKDNKTDYDFITSYSHSSVKFLGCTFGELETDRINELQRIYGSFIFDENCKFEGATYKNVVTVSSAKELIEAIRPDTVIQVKPGKYNLSEYANSVYEERGSQWNSSHKYVQIENVYDGLEFVIDGVENLTIYGLGNTREDVELIIEPRYATVLNYRNCTNIAVINMKAGHTDTGDCVGDVIGLTGCSEVVIDNMDLYGCGVVGVGVYQESGNVYVYSSKIHDCSNGPIVIEDMSREFVCINSELVDSDGGGYISPENESTAYFFDCFFGEQESNYYYFIDQSVCELYSCRFSDVTVYPDWEEDYDWEEEEMEPGFPIDN